MQKIKIIKIGGSIISDEEALHNFLINFSKLEGPKVLVHGGGSIASEQSKQMGIEVKIVNGRRITDKATIKMLTGVYAGQVNKNIVTNLQASGCNALGLTGADLNIIPAHKRKHSAIDFGYVGDFNTEDINTNILAKLIEMNTTPVFCALTHDTRGNMLNTNADTIASGLAAALSGAFAAELIYCFDKKGVLRDVNDDESLIECIDQKLYEELKHRGAIHEGMIPKLDNAFHAIRDGVQRVIIKHVDFILSEQGTVLSS